MDQFSAGYLLKTWFACGGLTSSADMQRASAKAVSIRIPIRSMPWYSPYGGSLKGGILADEVGLGKTIEAGLIIAQLMAEGMRRVLLVVPKSLLGQWQTELYALFGIEAREGRLDPEAFTGTGVFLTHRPK